MKVLLTGAAGFLGSHLSKMLLTQGHSVIGLDDLSTGSERNLASFQSHPNFKFINQDVREKLDFSVDAILNFACPASPIQYQANPIRTIETNFLGMKNVLELAVREGATVVQASTSEVYGDPMISPQVEEYWGNVNPIGIRSCYDEGKRAAETLCSDYKRELGVDVRIIRIFNTYGPNMAIADGRVVSNLIVQALLGNPMTIYGNGSQTRSFCYVDDLVLGVSKVLDLSEGFEIPINLGNPGEFSMRELATKIKLLTGSHSLIEYAPLPKDDPKQRKPDIARAMQMLGWQPSTRLDDGLLRTIEYFRHEIT
jgi:UDP-glucuronate decarboxylase